MTHEPFMWHQSPDQLSYCGSVRSRDYSVESGAFNVTIIVLRTEYGVNMKI